MCLKVQSRLHRKKHTSAKKGVTLGGRKEEIPEFLRKNGVQDSKHYADSNTLNKNILLIKK